MKTVTVPESASAKELRPITQSLLSVISFSSVSGTARDTKATSMGKVCNVLWRIGHVSCCLRKRIHQLWEFCSLWNQSCDLNVYNRKRRFFPVDTLMSLDN